MKKSHLAASALRHMGASRVLDAYWGSERLTVLAYHRISDGGTSQQFPYYHPNVSATPAMFVRQMAYVAEHFNVIDLETLNDFIVHGDPLPSRSLLITFDDGYLDNYVHAYPVLRDHGFSAVIFLLTNCVDNPAVPWWDECAYYFHHTELQMADLPLVGERDLATFSLRIAAREAVMLALKRADEAEKLAALGELRAALKVEPVPRDPALFMTWNHVRDLVANGVACQPHTTTHPIMTNVDQSEMRRQIAESSQRVKEETGQVIRAFAYPNGLPGDYDAATMQALHDEGITMAFTLTPGPMRVGDVRRHPLEIQRVYLGRRDTFDMFVMKTMGLPALVDRSHFVGEGS